MFLAIAVDNLADAANMTKIDEEEKRKKKDAKLMKKLAWKTKMDSLDSDGLVILEASYLIYTK